MFPRKIAIIVFLGCAAPGFARKIMKPYFCNSNLSNYIINLRSLCHNQSDSDRRCESESLTLADGPVTEHRHGDGRRRAAAGRRRGPGQSNQIFATVTHSQRHSSEA